MDSADESPAFNLLIMGASARAAAASAARAGFHPAACDLFADRDLAACGPAQQVQHYPQGLRGWLMDQAAVAKAAGHGPLPWLFTGALENHPPLIEDAAAEALLWGCDGRVIRAARDPAIWCEALHRAGLPTLPWLPGEQPSPGAGWLFKPSSSGGGTGIRAADQLAAPPSPGYWQKFQAGSPCSAVYVVGDRSVLLLGLTRQWIGQSWCGASGFQYCGSCGPWREPLLHPGSRRQLQAMGDCLGSQLGLRGLVGIDFIAAPGGPGGSTQFWPVEINPRYTASVEVLEAALGIAAVSLHATACTGGDLPRAISLDDGLTAKAIIFARHDVVIGEHLSEQMVEAAWFWPNRKDAMQGEGSVRRVQPFGQEVGQQVRAGVADIPRPGTFIARGRPICTLLATVAESGDDAEHRLTASLRQQVAHWENRIYHGGGSPQANQPLKVHPSLKSVLHHRADEDP